MKTTLLIALLALSGCVSIDEQAEIAGAKAGAPRWKIDAVKHGCNTGQADAGNPYASFNKDYEQYKNNPDYKMVWDDAYRSCRAKYQSNVRW